MEKVQKLIRKFVPALRAMLGLLFMYAGATKATDTTALAVQIQRFGLEDAVLSVAIAHYLPFLELACGLALLIRRFATGAILLCIVLLVMFEGGLAYAWHHGYEGGCGCFGKFFGGTSLGTALVRNLALLITAGVVFTNEATASTKGTFPR